MGIHAFNTVFIFISARIFRLKLSINMMSHCVIYSNTQIPYLDVNTLIKLMLNLQTRSINRTLHWINVHYFQLNIHSPSC